MARGVAATSLLDGEPQILELAVRALRAPNPACKSRFGDRACTGPCLCSPGSAGSPAASARDRS